MVCKNKSLIPRGSRLVSMCLSLFCLASQVTFAQNYWQQTNGPNGANVRALAIDASGRLFAGTSGSGVYRSTDNGGSWTPGPAARGAAMMSLSVQVDSKVSSSLLTCYSYGPPEWQYVRNAPTIVQLDSYGSPHAVSGTNESGSECARREVSEHAACFNRNTHSVTSLCSILL